ncbi:2-oxo acid dehydrogenase subunit E2 [Staphylococcus aureus]|nr:2-oxo acid dehydrogenase subunit E2 [Staphylococcus aureus]
MEITMPKLGESVHEGTIEQWLVSVGDHIDEYEPLCEVITDKVTAEVPSTISGTITEILVEAGQTVAIDTIICKIETADEKTNETTEEIQAKVDEHTQKSTKKASATVEQTSTAKQNQPRNNGRFSPVVFKLASEHDIDLSQVVGSGFEGRVTKKDIMSVIENGGTTAQSDKQVQTKSTSVDTSSNQSSEDNSENSTIPVNGVRKAIAQNMVNSVTEIPHAWMMIEVDATNLVNTRNHYKNSFKNKEGYNLTFFAFFVKAVADALKAYPLLNSSWQGNEIVLHKDINTLATKARNKQLTAEDMQGGTFTVNNTGTFGSVSSMGIINHPQAAILQVESIVKKPVVINDMIAIRNMVNLCISIDHRILDGLQTGKFMNHIKQRIEQYTLENTNIY